jgi:hypothetical protein
MVEFFRKSLKFASVFLTTFSLSLSRVNANWVPLSQTIVRQSDLGIMQIQQAPEGLTLPVISEQQQLVSLDNSFDNSLDMVKSKKIDSSLQKNSLVPCIDSDAECELSQITSVAELSDVQPTDWAYTALKSLIERYGLNFGENVNGKFQGNIALNRYEFATALNTVINSIEQQMKANQNIQLSLTQADLEILQRLQTEFAKELQNLKAKIEKLEKNLSENISQFSTTTKLTGEALFALSGVATTGENDETEGGNITFASRARLNLDTSFTGKDRLRTRLQARNLPRLNRVTGTDMASLAFQGGNNNQVEISRLDYSFPIGKQARVFIPMVGGSLRDFTDPQNPYLGGSSRGAISRFAQRNPIYRQGTGSGVGVSYEISDAVELEVGFLARDANDPEMGLSRQYGAIAQLTIEPVDDVEFGLTYVHSYNNLDTGTGSEIANNPFDDQSKAISANSFGFQSSIKISPDVTLGGWVGYTNATALDLPNNPNTSIFNWALTLALPNLGSQGNLAGFVIGQPPKVVNNDFNVKNTEYADKDSSLHLEAFYRFQTQENIAVTFGLLMIKNPEHNSNNDTIYIGTMRTTLSF